IGLRERLGTESRTPHLAAKIRGGCAAFLGAVLASMRFMLARLFKKAQASHRVSVSGLGVELEVPRDSTILEWALGKGIAFPHSCRVGTCGTCKCRLVSGKVYELSDRSYALTGEELAANYVLACQSMPR